MRKTENKHTLTPNEAKAQLVHEALRLRAAYLNANKAMLQRALKSADEALVQGRSPAYAVFSGITSLKTQTETTIH